MAALYRRYRPETFQEVIGQSHVTAPLQHALLSDRTHHAYLFSGPRGCGKTTSARILARCLNCAEGPTDTPCGVCPSCVELSRDGGGSLDVVEIDAASHNGVDDARELRERAIFAPARDRYKIYILDEAHMVTQQGFNALLKIVEEPPEHVKFIFATTEPDKVLATIRSRTHHYPFRLVSPAELLDYLHSVAEFEGVIVDEGVMALVVRSGGGSVRDSLSLLDQLIAGAPEKTITKEHAQNLLGYTPRVVLDDVVSALATQDAARAFQALDQVIQSGQDPRRFVEDLLAHIRDIIVIHATGAGAEQLFPGVSQGDLEMWREQSTWFDQPTLAFIGDTISHTLKDMSGVTAPRLQLELMVAKLLVGYRRVGFGDAPPSPMPTTSAPSQVAPSDQIEPDPTPSDPAPSGRVWDSPAGAPASDLSPTAETTGEVSSVTPLEPWSLEVLQSHWQGIVEAVGEQKRSLWVVLSKTQPVSLSGDVVSIGFGKRSDAEVLKKPQGPGSPLPNADLLREAIYQHTGHRLRFTIGDLADDHTASDRVVSTASPPSASGIVTEPPAEAAGTELPLSTDWPVVSRPGSDADDADSVVGSSESEQASASQGEEDVADGSDGPASASESNTPTSPIATRGEPVVRQVLGGELIGEEILEQMSDQGEADV